MKKQFLLFIYFLFSVLSIAAQKKPIVNVSYALFYYLYRPVIEFYFAFESKSLYFKRDSSGYWTGGLDVVILFQQKDTVKFADRINITMPLLSDTNNNQVFLYVSQMEILPGNYNLEIGIKDINSKQIPAYFNEDIYIPEYQLDKIMVSGIELAWNISRGEDANSPFFKKNYIIVPYPSNVFHENMNTFYFYAEVYNSQILPSGEEYLTRYYFEELPINIVKSNFVFTKKFTPSFIQSLTDTIDITDLPTGYYLFVIEVRNKKQELLAKNSIFIERINNKIASDTQYTLTSVPTKHFVQSIKSKDSLKYFIESLYPIASLNERIFINKLKKISLSEMQNFFYSFWVRRDPIKPEEAWLRYKAQVDYVEKMYSTQIKHGFETDRGRVYLQYGPPNSITSVSHEPSTYPYEIWHYYKINNQSNRKFVFYNPDLVTNDYQLLYSDVIGELRDYNWRAKLVKRNFASSNIDEQDPDFGWGSKINDYFKNPH
ncbi:MAG: GWxTD domain-containing protein [Bacteroidales bacterium]|nr:GWxTD domain-containing protein [Bacteroidales bacterium]